MACCCMLPALHADAELGYAPQASLDQHAHVQISIYMANPALTALMAYLLLREPLRPMAIAGIVSAVLALAEGWCAVGQG